MNEWAVLRGGSSIGGAVDKHGMQKIVQRYRSPYTAVGWAFVRALKLQPRPPLPHVERRKRHDSRRDMDECRRQTHGVEL